MSDVQFSIGGTPAPFISAMQQVKESASEGAKKVTESFGIEGVKSERALHSRLSGAFNDISKSGTNSAEAIGGAFENMAEGLKLSMGSMLALLAVSELVKVLYTGYEAAGKASAGVKDLLSIKSDTTAKTVEQTQAQIDSLKKDAEANNLSAMSSLQAGATAFVQALEQGKSISQVVREDAEHYRDIQNEIRTKEDGLAARKIENENRVLALRAAGHDKEADALAKQLDMEEKIFDAKNKSYTETADALERESQLQAQIDQHAEDKAKRQKEERLEGQQAEINAEKLRQSRVGHDTNTDKLTEAQRDTRDAASQKEIAKISYGAASEEYFKAELEYEKKVTAEKQVQADITKKNLEIFLKGNEQDAKIHKEHLERAEKIAKLQEEAGKSERELNAAKVDGSIFSGLASTTAKVGLGGGVTGANYGNASQLKASQEAATHLKDIKAEITKLSSSVGLAS